MLRCESTEESKGDLDLRSSYKSDKYFNNLLSYLKNKKAKQNPEETQKSPIENEDMRKGTDVGSEREYIDEYVESEEYQKV